MKRITMRMSRVLICPFTIGLPLHADRSDIVPLNHGGSRDYDYVVGRLSTFADVPAEIPAYFFKESFLSSLAADQPDRIWRIFAIGKIKVGISILSSRYLYQAYHVWRIRVDSFHISADFRKAR